MSGFSDSASSLWPLPDWSSALPTGASPDEVVQIANSGLAVAILVAVVAWCVAFVIVIQRERRR